MGYFVKSRQLQSGSTGVVLPVGNTSDRPINPLTGLIRYNTLVGAIEFYDGINYQVVGTANSITYLVDNFVGDGYTTKFYMSEPVAAANKILVFLGSIYQVAGDYYVDGTTAITFTEAPPDGMPFNVIHSYA